MPYKLPEAVPSDFRCVTVFVPNCPEALLALKASYQFLCGWYAWERTADRVRAKDMASAFKNADAFSFQECGDYMACDYGIIRQIVAEELEKMTVITNVNCGGCGGCGGCGQNGSELQNAAATVPQYAPIPSPATINTEEVCKQVTYVVDSIGDKIEAMSQFSFTAVVGLAAMLLLLINVVAPGIGFVVSVELATLLWQLVSSVGLTGEFIAQMSAIYNPRKQELICWMVLDTELSARSLRSKYLSWVTNNFTDGGAQWLFLYAMGIAFKWDTVYIQSNWEDTAGRCDACNETSSTLPTGYALAPAIVEYVSLDPYPEGNFSYSVDGGGVAYQVDLQANGTFFLPRFNLVGTIETGISDVVGLMLLCAYSNRSAYPIVKHSIRGFACEDGLDPLLGQIETGAGIAYLLANGNSCVADLTPFLNSQNVRIVANEDRGIDDFSVINDDPFNGRDKVNGSGTGGFLSVAFQLVWIYKVV